MKKSASREPKFTPIPALIKGFRNVICTNSMSYNSPDSFCSAALKKMMLYILIFITEVASRASRPSPPNHAIFGEDCNSSHETFIISLFINNILCHNNLFNARDTPIKPH